MHQKKSKKSSGFLGKVYPRNVWHSRLTYRRAAMLDTEIKNVQNGERGNRKHQKISVATCARKTPCDSTKRSWNDKIGSCRFVGEHPSFQISKNLWCCLCNPIFHQVAWLSGLYTVGACAAELQPPDWKTKIVLFKVRNHRERRESSFQQKEDSLRPSALYSVRLRASWAVWKRNSGIVIWSVRPVWLTLEGTFLPVSILICCR